MRRFLPALLLALGSLTILGAEELDLLQINVISRVLNDEEEVLWSQESQAEAPSGQSVDLRLKGDDLLIHTRFISYDQKEGVFLLVTQGEVWMSVPEEQRFRYFSTMKSFTVKENEPLLFYPLGAHDSTDGIPTIELEIRLFHDEP